MSGTSAGWSKERRAAHSAWMVQRNRDPEFIAQRRKGQGKWTPERRAEKSAQMKALNEDPAFIAKQRASILTRAPRELSVPQHVHPCVRGFFVAMRDEQASRADLSARSGIGIFTFTGWRKRHMPQLDVIDAALNAMDMELAIVPIGSRDANGFLKKKIKPEGVDR
jgi:hypothetical protein